MFTAVVAVYNHEPYLYECLLSACRSPLVDEVLVMDDGSRDSGPEILRVLASHGSSKFRNITVSPRRNQGAHMCWNQLVRAAGTEWVAVLNSDDFFLANRFELIDRWLQKTDCELIFGDLIAVDEIGRYMGIKRAVYDPEYPFPEAFDVSRLVERGEWTALLACQNFVATTSNMVFKKSLFERVGGFREYRYVHDWDFALRASICGKLSYIPHPLTCYRVHSANTIKESGRAVRQEVCNMFDQMGADYPEVFVRKQFQAGYRENTYVQPRNLQSIAVLLPEASTAQLYRNQILSLVGPLTFVDHISEIPAGCEYLYAPGDVNEALRVDQLRNVCLTLIHSDLDFVLVSTSLEVPPRVGVGRMRNHTVFSVTEIDTFLTGGPPTRPLIGRVLRLLPGQAPVVDLNQCFHGMECAIDGFEVTLGSNVALPIPDKPVGPPFAQLFPRLSHNKPVVFVMPVFLAVGGVERLTLEIMKQLRSRYDFVIVNTERLNNRLGSLHAQADGLAHACFDLAELGPQSHFLPMLRMLKGTYRPILVWICNGSPWQFDNADAIRSVFQDIPIVDQSAYDTEKGWIARYREPAIQSYDRFIAINRKIYDVFTSEMGMDPAKIDVIYHAIDLERLDELNPPAAVREAHALKYGVQGPGAWFAYIGRLAPQKRPLFFLELARKMYECGDASRFLLIGDGELASQCDEFIGTHGLTNVRRISYCEDLSEIYPLLSGLIVNSAYEGLPLVLLESLAMGVPALATDVGDIRMILDEYQAGLTVLDVESEAAFVSAFRRFVEALPRYRKNAFAAAPLIRERFSGASVAALYEQCWKTALAQFPTASSGDTRALASASGQPGKTSGDFQTPLIAGA